MVLKIFLKKNKEDMHWTKLHEVNIENIEKRRQLIIKEAAELMKISSFINEKTK